MNGDNRSVDQSAPPTTGRDTERGAIPFNHLRPSCKPCPAPAVSSCSQARKRERRVAKERAQGRRLRWIGEAVGGDEDTLSPKRGLRRPATVFSRGEGIEIEGGGGIEGGRGR